MGYFQKQYGIIFAEWDYTAFSRASASTVTKMPLPHNIYFASGILTEQISPPQADRHPNPSFRRRSTARSVSQ